MSQCACLAVHSCTGIIRFSREGLKSVDLRPGGQVPCLLRVRGSKLKVNC